MSNRICPCIQYEAYEDLGPCEICGHSVEEHGTGFDRSCRAEETDREVQP